MKLQFWTAADGDSLKHSSCLEGGDLEVSPGERARDTGIVIVLLFASMLFFSVLESQVGLLRGSTPVRLVVVAVLLLLGLGWSRRALPFPFVVVAFAVNLDCVIYLAGSWQTYDLGLEAGWANSVWIPVLVGALAAFRPALVLIPAIAVEWSKAAVGEAAGGTISGRSDYVIIPDLALMMGIFLAAFTIYQLVESRGRSVPWIRSKPSRVSADKYFTGCVVAIAGIHLSNYFYSGWEKVFLANSNPLTWVLQNPTYMLAIHTQDLGMLVIPNMTEWKDGLYQILVAVNTPLNIVVVLSQLAALFVLLSLRMSALVTVFYDVMHVAIFLLTSIFFWKWIVLNTALVLAFDSMRHRWRPVPKPILVFGCLIVLLAPYFSFAITRLAWFDTGGVNRVTFEAVTSGGETVRVPSNFFLNDSIGVAQQRFTGALDSYLPTGTWGTTGDANILHAIEQDCPAAARAWTLPNEARARIQAVIDHHHAQALSLSADGSGRFAYDIYPHHIWSSPWGYDEFAALDLRSVQSYVLAVDASCVSVGPDGRITRIPVGNSRYEFAVQAR